MEAHRELDGLEAALWEREQLPAPPPAPPPAPAAPAPAPAAAAAAAAAAAGGMSAATAAATDAAAEPEPESGSLQQGWQIYLPTKFDEINRRPAQVPMYGWQPFLQEVAAGLGFEVLDVKDRQKTGQRKVVCVVMQPYHLYKEFYIGRMANRNCWTTKFFGVCDLCEKVKMAKYLRNLAPLLGPDSPLLHTSPQTFVLPEDGPEVSSPPHPATRCHRDAVTVTVC